MFGRAEPLRVLHVEDDGLFAALVQATLGDAGLEVEWVTSAEAALSAAAGAEVPFDVFLLDLGLPRMRGDELAARLRAADPGAPIVFCSGDETELVNEPYVVAKPFAGSELVDTVARAAGPVAVGER